MWAWFHYLLSSKFNSKDRVIFDRYQSPFFKLAILCIATSSSDHKSSSSFHSFPAGNPPLFWWSKYLSLCALCSVCYYLIWAPPFCFTFIYSNLPNMRPAIPAPASQYLAGSKDTARDWITVLFYCIVFLFSVLFGSHFLSPLAGISEWCRLLRRRQVNIWPVASIPLATELLYYFPYCI